MGAMSHGDDSSDDETASTVEQVARVLQIHFDREEEDIGPSGGISIKTHSRRLRSVETASSSFESSTVASGASSRHRPVRGRGAFGGETRAEDLFIDIDDNFSRDEVHADLGT